MQRQTTKSLLTLAIGTLFSTSLWSNENDEIGELLYESSLMYWPVIEKCSKEVSPRYKKAYQDWLKNNKATIDAAKEALRKTMGEKATEKDVEALYKPQLDDLEMELVATTKEDLVSMCDATLEMMQENMN
ncbi:hypothetical protein [Pleionea litopenaei]|uniref:Uncharacterized protein n=1 Tax=Pleionea litopenaei TaxID=3070815 RepID=A0AA51RT72_9GAMM|nr:hypothetical protein [Pleionea sp. HL-JVS1]WMS87043.1 hypothetical protein Q9312_17685 [Pleionea sp. HL-JVS1]